MAPWFALIEAWAVAALIRSPTFNRAIQKAYRKINKIPDHEPKNGLGRTGPSALDHFKEEVKTQFKELTWQNRRPRK